jgi:hypothetical protein
MYAGEQAVKADRVSTINDRLNKMLDTLGYQCERIEAVLSRVNGTPQKIESAKGGIAPRPSLSMQNAIETLETTTERLTSLANGVEQIA